MEIPKSSSTSSRPLAIGNSGILSGFSGDIFKMAVQLRRSAEFISEANARFFRHTHAARSPRAYSVFQHSDGQGGGGRRVEPTHGNGRALRTRLRAQSNR